MKRRYARSVRSRRLPRAARHCATPIPASTPTSTSNPTSSSTPTRILAPT